ncbi:uncharacterized protein LOC132718642 isoform X2 [Ruditapes philippinarum]|uniref:uncharacterized protein LOC132718642 isoform X2 n=1 Tax=Ruditapes philippinarum TaxID=129788 RepID=UPI00295BA1C4|nr:uncharacterized protein LOC132718642 isoform X2 [Ruditapes philippinarum]
MDLDFLYAVMFSLFSASRGTYDYGCVSYKTVFVPVKSTAIFQTFSSCSVSIKFIKIYPTYQRLFKFEVSSNESECKLNIYDYLLEDRVNISVLQVNNNKSEVKIELKDVNMNDNGTYMLLGSAQECFVLFIMKIEQEPGRALEENEPVKIHAHPLESVIKRSKSNATIVWLLNEISIDHSAYFIKQDGYLWISQVKKEFNGKSVTYRVIQDGTIIDVSYMLNVRYGPSFPLTLTPEITHYNLVSGDVMPDIICTAECNPPCHISWGKSNSGGLLSLDTVTTGDSGEYTCIATRAGGQTIERTITVFVSDDSSLAIEVLTYIVTIQVIVTLGLALCVVFICKRGRVVSCCFDKTKNPSQNAPGTCTNSTTIWL